jgi:hypothetical protein
MFWWLEKLDILIDILIDISDLKMLFEDLNTHLLIGSRPTT